MVYVLSRDFVGLDLVLWEITSSGIAICCSNFTADA
jgi:hypothetical protein